MPHGGAFLIQIFGQCAQKTLVANPVQRMDFGRQIPPRQLVFALRPSLDPRQTVSDRLVDRLMVAQFEMQEGVILDTAPITTV